MFCPEGWKLKKRLSWESIRSALITRGSVLKVASHARLPPLSSHIFPGSLTVGINSAAGSCMFSTGMHPCGPRMLWWFHEHMKFSAASFATYVVTQEEQNIVSGQTTITTGDNEILSKDFFTEGKIWNVSFTFSTSSWQPRADIFSKKDVFK